MRIRSRGTMALVFTVGLLYCTANGPAPVASFTSDSADFLPPTSGLERMEWHPALEITNSGLSWVTDTPTTDSSPLWFQTRLMPVHNLGTSNPPSWNAKVTLYMDRRGLSAQGSSVRCFYRTSTTTGILSEWQEVPVLAPAPTKSPHFSGTDEGNSREWKVGSPEFRDAPPNPSQDPWGFVQLRFEVTPKPGKPPLYFRSLYILICEAASGIFRVKQ
ncbi:MAG: hypothetical protein K1X53_16550 [Candidatus Sumerlaeaceae bacterium]|nr:hypothetical protein [Candidatus Sumerlaeaceae bacterium]